MGDEADDILRSFALSDDDRKKYQPVTARFEAHFIKKRNVIYERARFKLRRQDQGEPVDSFLAEHCAYGNLHDEMVGIRNAALSEKLQLDPALTLEKAVIAVCQAEAIKEQQPLLRGIPVSAIQKSRAGSQDSGATHPGSCTRCGRVPAHERKLCPARDAICRKCQKRGHFQAMCRSAAKLHRVMDLEDGPSSDNTFMGTVGDLSSHNPGTPSSFALTQGLKLQLSPSKPMSKLAVLHSCHLLIHSVDQTTTTSQSQASHAKER